MAVPFFACIDQAGVDNNRYIDFDEKTQSFSHMMIIVKKILLCYNLYNTTYTIC